MDLSIAGKHNHFLAFGTESTDTQPVGASFTCRPAHISSSGSLDLDLDGLQMEGGSHKGQESPRTLMIRANMKKVSPALDMRTFIALSALHCQRSTPQQGRLKCWKERCGEVGSCMELGHGQEGHVNPHGPSHFTKCRQSVVHEGYCNELCVLGTA